MERPQANPKTPRPSLIGQLILMATMRRNLRSKLSHIEQIQRKKLLSIVKYAYESIPFYHKKFNAAGIKPYEIKNISDFSKIPFTTKSELQASLPEELVCRKTDLRACIKRTTSGSTGRPLAVYVNKDACAYDSLVWYRALFENGLRIRDKVAFLRNPRDFPRKEDWLHRVGLLRSKYVSTFCSAETQLTLLREFRPDALRSTPSSLELLALECRDGVGEIHPRFIVTVAELLDNETRKMINQSYRAEVLDNYASEEFSLMAWECRKHLGYHINSDNVLLELVHEDEPVLSGERGEIVCTGLNNYAMPLIRYKIGDIGVSSEEPCSCGVTLPLMKVVEGRKDDFLITLEGGLIGPSARQIFDAALSIIEGMVQYRVIQEKRDRLIVQLAVNDLFKSDDRILERAEKELRKVFGEGMQFEFHPMAEIRKDPSGKMRKFISRVPTKFEHQNPA